MKYHFVVNGYAKDARRQMEEQAGFARKYLGGLVQGEAIIYCKSAEDIQELQANHAKEAIIITGSQYVPEAILETLCARADSGGLYIFGSDGSGVELAVRMAARLSGSSATEVGALHLPEKQKLTEVGALHLPEKQEATYEICKLYISKKVYANHMEAVFSMDQGPFCISLARGVGRQELNQGGFAVKEEIACKPQWEYLVSQEFYPEDAEVGLADAKVILAAGRGVNGKVNMAVVDEAAKHLGAEVAVSRPAAMNVWKPMDRLIGVSGVLAEPEICITAGVSGAAAFYAGIEKSKFIAAINTDGNAPIMKMADVAIEGDFLPILEELIKISK